MRKAIDYFQQAIAKDPNYALAYAGLADASHELAYNSPPSEMMPRSKAASTKALQLDDSVVDAHAADEAIRSGRRRAQTSASF
jgi:hypothetical protein